MEVHHHSHPASGETHTSRKKWTHYFWEFLMLFLAVFCGFLAEYQLEHMIERQREKQYMQSFIYDLQNDTLNLNEGFPRKDGRIMAIDSLLSFFKSYPGAKTVPGYVIRQMRRSVWDRHYRRNSASMDQLKNAGGLRLLRKRNVADSIAAYDLQWQRAEFWREGYTILQEKAKDMLHKILPAGELLFLYEKPAGYSSHLYLIDTIRFRINTEHLNEFLNFIADQKLTTTQDKAGYKAIEQSAERLMGLIKKEYHFK